MRLFSPARLLLWSLWLLMFAVLAGCASPTQAPPPAPTWTGRLSVQVAAQGVEPARGFNGQFELRGTTEAGSLEVSGPLGLGAVRASWAAGRYRLIRAQDTQEFGSLDELAMAGLGEALPLAALFDWLSGRPWHGAPAATLAEGRAGFEQLGWRIDTADLSSGRLRAQRISGPLIQLRIVLDAPNAS